MLTEAQRDQVDQINELLEAHGYFIAAEPIDGMEGRFVAALDEAACKIKKTAASLRKHYGYRGLSANLLRELHISLPVPSFNIESRLIAEIEARERRFAARQGAAA